MKQLFRACSVAVIAMLMSSSAPAQQWRGFYCGGHAGYGRGTGRTKVEGRVDEVVDPETWGMATSEVKSRSNGFLFGAQAGYNWQNDNTVFGVEMDFSKPDLEKSKTTAPHDVDGVVYPLSYIRTRQETKWLSTIRARAGYAPSDKILAYLTAGVAFAKMEYSSDVDFSERNGYEWHYPKSYSKIQGGYAIGVGAEWAFSKMLSTKVEYLHYDIGKKTKIGKNQPIPGYPADVRYTWDNRADLLRLGLNYRF